MTEQQRIEDISSITELNNTEVEKYDDERINTFASIEYYIIFHYTNEEYNFLTVDEINNLTKYADLIEETQKAFIYCFK